MYDRNAVAFGIYATHSSVTSAVYALNDAGFVNTEVSELAPCADAHPQRKIPAPVAQSGKAALAGGMLFSFLGIGLLGIPAFRMLAVPLLAALGIAFAGVALGGYVGALFSSELLDEPGVPERQPRPSGHLLLTVLFGNADSIQRATEILANTGAENIGSTTS